MRTSPERLSLPSGWDWSAHAAQASGEAVRIRPVAGAAMPKDYRTAPLCDPRRDRPSSGATRDCSALGASTAVALDGAIASWGSAGVRVATGALPG